VGRDVGAIAGRDAGGAVPGDVGNVALLGFKPGAGPLLAGKRDGTLSDGTAGGLVVWLGVLAASGDSVRRAWTAVPEETAAPGIGLVVTGVWKESPGARWRSEVVLAVTAPCGSLAPRTAGVPVGAACDGDGERGAEGLPRAAFSADGCWFELRRNRAHRARTNTQMAAFVNVLVQFRAGGATENASGWIGKATGSADVVGGSRTTGYCVAGESFRICPETAGIETPAAARGAERVGTAGSGIAAEKSAAVRGESIGKPAFDSEEDWTVGKENRTGTERAGPCCRRLVERFPGRTGELWGVFAGFMGAIPFEWIPDPSTLPVLGKDVSARRSDPKTGGRLDWPESCVSAIQGPVTSGLPQIGMAAFSVFPPTWMDGKRGFHADCSEGFPQKLYRLWSF
jgi:hypothetical protein